MTFIPDPKVKMMQAKGRHPSNPPSMGIRENGLKYCTCATLDVMITYLLLVWYNMTCHGGYPM